MKKQEALNLIEALTRRVDAVGEDAFVKGVWSDVGLLEAIFSTYKAITGKDWKVTCRSCYFDCYSHLYGLAKNNEYLDRMENKIYHLKKGALLQGFPHGGNDKDCTDATITTELAEWHLKKDPYRIVYFNEFPEDWQKRIGYVKDEPIPEQITNVVTAENTLTVAEKTRKEMIDDLREWGKLDKRLELANKNVVKKAWLEAGGGE
jgi:hypothetical protein